MSDFKDSYLSGGNIDFIEALYARYLDDPANVDASWREVFARLAAEGRALGRPIVVGAPAPSRASATPQPGGTGVNGRTTAHGGNGVEGARLQTVATETRTALSMGLQARVDQTIYAFRLRGHLLAQLDPLGRPIAPLEHVADLGMVSDRHFSDAELEERVSPNNVFQGSQQVRLRDILGRLRRTYCERIGAEYMHMLDSRRRRWLENRMEVSENRTHFSPEQQRRILTKLSYAEGFESFLHTKYVGAKRFSLDGGESLVPMVDALLELGGELGIRETVIGMAHRGRLNLLTNILGKSPDQIFSEFDGPVDPKQYLNRGDVKYHQGFSSDYVTQTGKKIHLSLAFNPSHLEVVYPVVEGRVRAKQDRFGDKEGKAFLPLVIHGDAAFAGQGLIAETLNLSELDGYATGGTVHIVINNQIGFTTEPHDSRSTHYCTANAQMLDIPIFHVNGDDPEACVHAMRMALEYRQEFHSDVVIDLVCFRRYGHNEGDEPTFTQPGMYELIRAHPTVRSLYAQALAAAGSLPAKDAEAIKQQCLKEFQEAHDRAKAESRLEEPSFNQGLWKGYRGGAEHETPNVDTGVAQPRLRDLLTQISTWPEGFTPHPKVTRLLETRRAMAEGKQPLDWAAAESLALATLLTEGYRVRLTGQDSERGTFSQRHAVLHDVKTGARHMPLAMLPGADGRCTLLNSPLSEMGCLGFEFGYSLDYPDALVAWEAQFGDFVNNAQVMVDQFIAAAEDKWRRLSGLTLLLPHGYEGQGPEHSSARLERFLSLCGEDNIQVCYPTTPAQFFHLLRRQVVRPLRKPLVVMTPKSMLRKPEAASPLADLTHGQFKRVLGDAEHIDLAHVTRLLLCSGKVYYDLLQGRDAKKKKHIGIVRVEQLYPLPHAEVAALLAKMTHLKELFWVQEEPKNNGAWRYMIQPLQEWVTEHKNKPRYGFIGRVESASPATGYHDTHVYEQQMIVDEAIS